MELPLQDHVALVTGASRGIGRGTAHELGVAGATVFVTGRSRDRSARTDDLPGTVDGTARLVTEAGGTGIAIACDHTEDGALGDLAVRIEEAAGRLDLLVNNVWGGYEAYDPTLFRLPVHEQPLWRWDHMWESGVRAHYTTTRAVLPLLLRSDRALIVEISAGDDDKFLGDVQYDVAKNAMNRLGFALASRLRGDGVTALTIHPGFTRTERVMDAMEGQPPQAFENTHSARFVGRAVVALATDPGVASRSGGVFKAGTLGLEYGFRDVDGSQPAPFVIGAGEEA